MTTCVAVDVGGTNIRAARYTPEGEVIDRARRPTISGNGREAILDRILAAIHDVMPADGANGDDIHAIGVGVPGALDPRTGIVLRASSLPGWVDFPLKRELESRFCLPVAIGNDANLAALAEWKFGAGRGHDDVLYLTISTGIGGGVISGGRLITGAGGLAAELGHVTVAPRVVVAGTGIWKPWPPARPLPAPPGCA
jgi:glucokinase